MTTRRLVDPRQHAQERRLPGTVATHDREDLALVQVEVELSQHRRLTVRGAEPPDLREHRPVRVTLARRIGRREHRVGARRGQGASRADGQRERIPAQHPPEARHRRPRSELADHVGWGPGAHPAAVEPDRHVDPSGDTLQTVLGEEDRHAMIVHEPLERCHDVFRTLRIELRGRFV